MRPWESGQLPATAQQAREWIAAGWTPTGADIRRLGPAGAAALGLEYVVVTPDWKRILVWGVALSLLAAVFFRRRRLFT